MTTARSSRPATPGRQAPDQEPSAPPELAEEAAGPDAPEEDECLDLFEAIERIFGPAPPSSETDDPAAQAPPQAALETATVPPTDDDLAGGGPPATRSLGGVRDVLLLALIALIVALLTFAVVLWLGGRAAGG